MRNLTLLIVAGSLMGCSSLTPTNDPVYLRITDLEARLLRMERVLENESLIALAGDINSLREELRQIRGEVETLGFELEQQGQRQLDLYTDLDQRLVDLESARRQAAAMPAGSDGAPAGAAATDQQAYDAAFQMLQQQNWSGAQAAFRSFLSTYPASSLRGNAQYWLGETHYAELDFAGAVTEFQRVLNDYPQSNKTADALLKLGYSHHELGDPDRARQALLRVVREFANTSAANLANQRLQQIAQEAG